MIQQTGPTAINRPLGWMRSCDLVHLIYILPGWVTPRSNSVPNAMQRVFHERDNGHAS
jgi:hypothetical protein